MKVLLINSPLYRDPGDSYDDVLPPIGLGYLCTALKQQNIAVELLDALAGKMKIGDIVDYVEDGDFSHVGINIFSTNKDLVQEIVCSTRKKVTFLIGANFTKSNAEEIIKRETPNNIDVMIGEGDLIISDIVKGSTKEAPILEKPMRRVFKVDKNSAYFPHDISNISLDRSFFKYEPTINSKTQEKECNIISSRGCIYNCAFCSAAASLNLDSYARERSVEDIESELFQIQKSHPEVSSIRILDDLFLRNASSVERAVNIFRKFDFNWRAMAHIQSFKSLTHNQILSLKESGCNEVSIGIESGSDRILKSINKVNTVVDIKETIEKIFNAGLGVKGYFMIGLPGETKKEIENTYKLAKYLDELSIFYGVSFRVSAFQFRPYHGTKIYKDLVNKGINIDNITPINVGNKRIGEYDFSSGNYSLCSEDEINIMLNKIREINDNRDTYIPWQQPENFIFHENWFIGLSHKLGNDGKVLDAFDTSTTSGKVISSIQQKSKHSITMLNLVPGVPLDENGKLRYPSATEKTLGYRILKDKILTYKPKKCFLFGKHVQDLFIKDSDVIQKDDCYKLGETALIFKSHPSYISTYRKSEISSYEQDILFNLGIKKYV